MKAIYRIRLKPKSNWRTLLSSDTLAGYMMWLLKHNTSEFDNIYKRFVSGEAPFVLSDGFPGDTLPTPCQFSQYGVANKLIDYLPRELFDTATKRSRLLEFLQDPDDNLPHYSTCIKGIAQIDRDITSSSAIDMEESFTLSNADFITIYGYFADKETAELVEEQFKIMQYHGFGRGSSKGYGQFELLAFEQEKKLFKKSSKKTMRVALSHFIPLKGEAVPDYFQYRIKSGKIGERGYGFAKGDLFHKKPLPMILPGACFLSSDEEICGGIAKNITADKKVIQLGHAILMPVNPL